MADGKNPFFRNAPVVETVLGVQFDPLQGLSNAHLGAFWAKLVPDWTDVSDATPLPVTLERFDDEQPWLFRPGLRLEVTRDSATRLRIKNRSQDRMIQAQNGRFHYNWLGQGGGEYPRYSEVHPEFVDTFARFCSFIDDLKLGKESPHPKVAPNQWEVTYVNHIPKGTVWESAEDWGAIFPKLLATDSVMSSGKLESFESEWHFEIPPERGRLHVALRYARRTTPEPPEILHLQLTARGPIEPDGVSVEAGLEIGHQAIIQSFKELTSSASHDYWGLEE